MEPHEETSRCFSPFLKWFALTFMYSDPYLHFVYWFWSSFVFCLSFFHQLGCIYWICVLGWFCSCIVLRVTSLSLSLCISLSVSLCISLSLSLSFPTPLPLLCPPPLPPSSPTPLPLSISRFFTNVYCKHVYSVDFYHTSCMAHCVGGCDEWCEQERFPQHSAWMDWPVAVDADVLICTVCLPLSWVSCSILVLLFLFHTNH